MNPKTFIGILWALAIAVAVITFLMICHTYPVVRTVLGWATLILALSTVLGILTYFFWDADLLGFWIGCIGVSSVVGGLLWGVTYLTGSFLITLLIFGGIILALVVLCLVGMNMDDKKATAAPQAAGGSGSILLFVIFCLYLAGGDSSSGPSGSGGYSSDKEVGAWIAAQGFVSDRLKSPSSADFGSGLGYALSDDYQSSDTVVTNLGGGRYRIDAWVEAQNGFGATIRTPFSCEVQETGAGHFQCNELYISE